MSGSLRTIVAAAVFLNVLGAASATAQAPLRKIGEMEVALVGLRATVDPAAPVVPKHTASGVRIVVQAGARELSAGEVARFFGAGVVYGLGTLATAARFLLHRSGIWRSEKFRP